MDILIRKLKPHPEAMLSKVGDEAVILHMANATYYGLDQMGLVIWQGIEAGKMPKIICDEIATECEVDETTVEDDTRQFLADMLAHALILIEQPS